MSQTFRFSTVWEGGSRMVWKKDEYAYTWHDLDGHVAPEILCVPRTGSDPTGTWPKVHARVLGYVIRNVRGKPWIDHLALIAAVMTAQRRDVGTVEGTLKMLHQRFSSLCPLFALDSMSQWAIEPHLVSYLRGEVLAQDTLATRMGFFRRYMSATKLVASWWDFLPQAQQNVYRPFVLPALNPFLAEEFSPMEKAWVSQQQTHRKAETEAVVPAFTTLRAEAHFRFNRLHRLRQAYQQAVKQVLPDHSNLPLTFGYEEGDPPVERLQCRVWDRRSFVLFPEHIHHYCKTAVKRARGQRSPEKCDHQDLFLEIIDVERLDGNAPPEGFWFTDLLTQGVLGKKIRVGTPEEIAAKQAWLRAWGYGEDDQSKPVAPFDVRHPGLLTWPDASMGRITQEAQARCCGTLVPVESLYAATTFGLLALELLTTTGMRMNELMQVSLLPECLVRLIDDAPPGATDQTPRIRYVLRLLPKGERTDKRHHYGIGRDGLQLIEQTGHLLCDHYHLQPGEPLPRVQFAPRHSRSHRFEEQMPYIFQYHQQHLDDIAISACLRFLLHGMSFQTSEGAPVILKPHLLRHAFATFAVQVEGLPLDLVAEWLKQKNLDVTRYYSKKGQQDVAEEHASFVERLATEINVREAIVRSPEEVRQLAEQARRRVGTLVPVCGGECTFDGWCHNQFDCIRCPSKAPEPEKRYQVEEKQRWAEERLAYYEREGLVLEAEKMRHLLRNCALELREMEMMDAYRKDENQVAQVKFYPRKLKE